LVQYMSILNYQDQQTSQFWFDITRSLWIGRQITFGLIIGAILALVFFFYFLAEEDITDNVGAGFIGGIIGGGVTGLIVWFIAAFIALIFGWGFGFGYGWNISWFAGAIGVISVTGLATSLVIWTKAPRNKKETIHVKRKNTKRPIPATPRPRLRH